MTKLIRLGSGNYFFYQSQDHAISRAYVTDPSKNKFLGGFLGQEADRKLRAFESFPDCESVETYTVTEMTSVNLHGYDEVRPVSRTRTIDVGYFEKVLLKLSFEEYAEKLGDTGEWFLKFRFKFFDDLSDANGTNSSAQSCDDRKRYYEAVGLGEVYKTELLVPLWGFVANHLSVFGSEGFERTWSGDRSQDDWEKDTYRRVKTRYTTKGFKLPAAYFKFLCYSLRHEV